MAVTQVMALLPIIAVALVLIISFVAWRVRLEHRRYDEIVRVLDKRSAAEHARPVAPVALIHSGGNAQRPAPYRLRAERAISPRRSATARTRPFRVIES